VQGVTERTYIEHDEESEMDLDVRAISAFSIDRMGKSVMRSTNDLQWTDFQLSLIARRCLTEKRR
jgi:hypothetical protein